ncbi:hypothetical protein [Priestia megaterium]|uniref:hypothetical protein n=1 Tax=Priestia megaterium TaxID=1404 RepID=UPI000BF79A55|nr:hypothetical protein [Priestia megaterium]PFQ82041.1 hypothetical protein COK11_16305 [Priestia megaterium]
MPTYVKETILKTDRDYRGLVNPLNDLFTKLTDMDYGIYEIEADERHVFVMAENMVFVQESLNKGIRLLGGWGTRKVEIYNYKEQQEKISKSYEGFRVGLY